MDWLNKTMTKMWPYIDQVSVGDSQLIYFRGGIISDGFGFKDGATFFKNLSVN